MAYRKLNEGDPVFYWKDPVLFGEMEVRATRTSDKRVVCIIDPDLGRGSQEIFARRELRLASEILVAAG